MVDGFIRKKVESLTLGEKLVKLRSQYRMSLQEISRATRIQVKYLEALESGDHRGLPAEVYVRGFLRSYARYLGLEDEAFIKLYDQEKHIKVHLGQAEPKHERTSFILKNAWVITPRTMTMIGIGVVLLGTFGYLFHELSLFVAEPRLVLMEPVSGQVVSEATIIVQGETDRGAHVTLNGEPVFVGNDGLFREGVSLQPGTNTLVVEATNRFDKAKTLLVTVEYAAQESAPVVPPSSPEPLAVVVSATEAHPAVTLRVDNVIVWNGAWPKVKRETFEVRESLEMVANRLETLSLQVGSGSAVVAPQSGGELTGIRLTVTRSILEQLAKTTSAP